MPPSYLTQLFIKVLNRQNGLGVVYDGLPVSGQSGTLGPGYNRFTGDNAVARGAVHAKTGWIDNGYTLAGIVDAADGTQLTFAVFALGPVMLSPRSAESGMPTIASKPSFAANAR